MRNVRSKDNEKQHIPKQSVFPEYTCQKQSIKNLSHKNPELQNPKSKSVCSHLHSVNISIASEDMDTGELPKKTVTT